MGITAFSPTSPWPFSRYDMFANYASSRKHLYFIDVSSTGRKSRLRPWQVLSLEFYKVNDLIDKTFDSTSSDEKKQSLCMLITKELLKSNWEGLQSIKIIKFLSAGSKEEILYRC